MDRRLEEEIAGSEDVFPSSEDVLIADSADIADGASLGHGARRRPPADDERHLGRHLRQRVEDVPDSVEEVPDSVDDESHLGRHLRQRVDDVLDSIEEVPDVDEVVDCPRCRTFHAGGVFGEACRQARRNARRCTRCGLLHEDYDLLAQVLDGMKNFDCEFYIPVVEELQMQGDTIILPEQVVQKLDEMYAARKSAKANKEGEASKDEARKLETTYGFG